MTINNLLSVNIANNNSRIYQLYYPHRQHRSKNRGIVNSPINYQNNFFSERDKRDEMNKRICSRCGVIRRQILYG